MTVTAGNWGSGTVAATAEYIFQPASSVTGVTAIQVWNEDSTNALIVSVNDGIAGASIPGGKTSILRIGTKEIRNVQCSAAASTEVHWGVVAITGQEW